MSKQFSDFAANPKIWANRGGISKDRNITVLLENDGDKVFWRPILNSNFKITFTEPKDANGKDKCGKDNLFKHLASLNENYIIACDADFDLFCSCDHDVHHAIHNNQRVIHTIAYGRENFLFTAEFIGEFVEYVRHKTEVEIDVDNLIRKYGELCHAVLPLYLYMMDKGIVGFDRDKLCELIRVDLKRILNDDLQINESEFQQVLDQANSFVVATENGIFGSQDYAAYLGWIKSHGYHQDISYRFIPCHELEGTTNNLLNRIYTKIKNSTFKYIKANVEPTEIVNRIKEADNHYKDVYTVKSSIAHCHQILKDDIFADKIRQQFAAAIA